MKITTLASIYIGSYEIYFKIQELVSKRKIRDVENIRCRLNLGPELYKDLAIDYETVDELCERLNDLKQISETYRCDECRVYAGSALRHAGNKVFVLDQVKIRTGLDIRILSNSEQKNLGYRAVSVMDDFPQITKEGCAILDIGGGSMQITMFEGGHMNLTKQVPFGTMRVMNNLTLLRHTTGHPESQIMEMADKEMEAFRILYGGNKKIKHIVVLGKYLNDICRHQLNTPCELGISPSAQYQEVMKASEFKTYISEICGSTMEELGEKFDFLNINDPVFFPSMIMYYCLIKAFKAEYIWVPSLDINDGIGYAYAQNRKILKCEHNYEDDVISCAKEIAKRYNCDEKHIETMERFSLGIFDTTKKFHGMTKRERLLLQTAVYLHDCGKYVCLSGHSQMSYHMIMASEIIGLTHRERKIIALAVKYHEMPLEEYDEYDGELTTEDYMVVAKISAILRLSNALDRSHKQKMQEFKITVKERDLVITVRSEKRFYWEQIKFQQEAEIFEKVFCLKPVLKEKRL